jgi:FAD synthetase
LLFLFNFFTLRYTSIGAETDTLPNPELKQKDGNYSPAYKLVDGTKERAGRLSG